ncbi:hypothetical protein LEP1GSC065_3364 [Leptospira kirschneri serovar Sokoine str. RM1]|nr:hypothetical protein LEP1GSC065_3364 [Leptospira kirschneri serovar Sokoine str. RM1]
MFKIKKRIRKFLYIKILDNTNEKTKKKSGSENYASIKKSEVNLIPIKVISELVV